MGLLDKLKKKDKIEKETDSKKSADVKVEEKKKDKIEKEAIKKPETKREEKTASKTNPLSRISNKILVKPLISEKAAIGEQEGLYVFVVSKDANKYQIKEAVKEVYGETPEKIRVVNVEGKRTYGGKREGKRQDWKKAFVKMPKGKTINIHEGV